MLPRCGGAPILQGASGMGLGPVFRVWLGSRPGNETNPFLKKDAKTQRRMVKYPKDAPIRNENKTFRYKKRRMQPLKKKNLH